MNYSCSAGWHGERYFNGRLRIKRQSVQMIKHRYGRSPETHCKTLKCKLVSFIKYYLSVPKAHRETCFLVLDAHVCSCQAHGFDSFVKGHPINTIASHRKLRRRDGLYSSKAVPFLRSDAWVRLTTQLRSKRAYDARHLHEAVNGIARQAKIMFFNGQRQQQYEEAPVGT